MLTCSIQLGIFNSVPFSKPFVSKNAGLIEFILIAIKSPSSGHYAVKLVSSVQYNLRKYFRNVYRKSEFIVGFFLQSVHFEDSRLHVSPPIFTRKPAVVILVGKPEHPDQNFHTEQSDSCCCYRRRLLRLRRAIFYSGASKMQYLCNCRD